MDIHAAAAVIRQAVNPQRLLHTAQQLIAVPSPTRPRSSRSASRSG